MDAVSATNFVQSLEPIDRDSFADDATRREALSAARALCMRLESPMDTMTRLTFFEPIQFFTLKIAVDLEWFVILANAEGPLDSNTLAAKSGAEVALTRRVVRHLGTTGIIRECQPGMYQTTPLANELAANPLKSTVLALFNMLLPMSSKLPEYFQINEYKTPPTQTNGPWQFAASTSDDFFTWLKNHPSMAETFSNLMECFGPLRPPWTDLYPSGELITGADPRSPLLVDIGGNKGTDLEYFIEKHQKQAENIGQLVLQDLPQVIEMVHAQPSIHLMAYDFFKPQPVIGARAYFLHNVLHDWPDVQAVQILKNLGPALKANYSKLLICEVIITERGTTPEMTGSDLVMMGFFQAAERTEQDWRRLLEEAGYLIIRLFAKPGVMYGVIEAELA